MRFLTYAGISDRPGGRGQDRGAHSPHPGEYGAGEKGSILLVPEQYSHEAERELCRVCGDRLSLYAEVLSFSGLARSLETRRGGAAAPWLDQGGRMLCMALALQGVGARLKVYGAAQRRAEMQAMLLKAVDELKTARVDSAQLFEAAASCPDTLGDKLRDLALVLEAYEGVVSNGRADPADRLTRLAEAIDDGGLEQNTKVYVDGFIDFTRQEQEVLCAMLRQGLRLTVCLTLDDLHGENEIFELSRRARARFPPRRRSWGRSRRSRAWMPPRTRTTPCAFLPSIFLTIRTRVGLGTLPSASSGRRA